jgi:hypothetical protein
MTDIAIQELEFVSLPHLDLLHYLLSGSDGKHVAHCLDLDLVATGACSACNLVRFWNSLSSKREI